LSTLPATLLGHISSDVWLESKDVHIEQLDVRLQRFVSQAGQVHSILFKKPLVITSGNDGAHATNSAHYRNAAVDLRTKDIAPLEQYIFLVVLVHLAEEERIMVSDERLRETGPHYHCELAG